MKIIKKEGVWKKYHPNGKISVKGFYTKGNTKTGVWEYFDESGLIIKTEKY